MAKKPPADAIPPDQRKLTTMQATRLGALTDIDASQLAGHTIADLSERLKWQIDPELLLFRKVCGKVVKKDPITNVEYPVPFATVIVEDTDCSLVTYLPGGWPWGWIFPLLCHREVLATVKTDRCGHFCVWIPRFDIDWILHWRKVRVCFPDLFVRPSIRDLLPPIERLRPLPPVPPPRPDPGPLTVLRSLPLDAVEALSGRAGRAVAERLATVQASRTLGGPAPELDTLADTRAFDEELPPPLPEEFRMLTAGQPGEGSSKTGDLNELIRSTLALRLGLTDKELERFDIGRYLGPFLRCVDVYLPEWQRVVDVPDITFKVTQDTNGDGTEEVIYSEGFFDVRWNAGAIPDVTLVASAIARESHLCDTPDVPCGDTPAILFAGLMPLTDPAYFDVVEGYARRPNRPIPPVPPRPPAKTPFLRTLQLYGCVNVPGAKFYRVLLSADNGATWSAVTGLHWNIYPLPSGPPFAVTADASGWYEVLANPDAFHPARMVIEWPTPSLGRYLAKVEIGDAAKNVVKTSAVVAIQVDNTSPTVIFDTLKWKHTSEPDSAFDLPGRDLLVTCPTIHRGSSPQDVDVQFQVTVSAHHLRNGYIYARTCSGVSLAPLTTPTPHTTHWHDAVTDNAEVLSGRYRIGMGQLEGAYTFGCRVNSRAMNPAGGDGGHLADWFYDPVYVYRQPEIHVAIVDA